MLILYQVEWCPSCHTVRQVLTELGLSYTAINVPLKREQRAEVMAVSGQDSVPVLQDGDRILTETTAIVRHLRDSYPAPADAAAHAEAGDWRISRTLSRSPHSVLSELRHALVEHGFAIVAETRGPELSTQLPADYALLGVVLPEAAAQAVREDPAAPGAVLISLSVAPADGGGSVVAAADPVGQIWLFADQALRRTQAVTKRRLKEVLAVL